MKRKVIVVPKTALAEQLLDFDEALTEDLFELYLSDNVCVRAYSLSLLNTLMILMLTAIAVSLFKMLESIATPCSVKALGSFLVPPQLDVTFCDIKSLNSFSDN